MATEKLVVLKDDELAANCPECYNKSLRLAFYQKHINSKFYNKITNEVTNQLTCNTCSTSIYPARWTDDIDRLFNYYQKMVVPQKKAVKFTAAFYILILSILVLAAVGYYLYSESIIQF